jgi:hypothetical protein
VQEPVLIQMGFRRLVVRPLYSQNNVGSDKHKFERFLQPGRFSVASFFGPITYPAMPILMFKNECTFASVDVSIAADGLQRTGLSWWRRARC